MRESSPRPGWTRFCSAASWVLVLASPLVFYVAVRHARVRDGALFVVAYAILRALPTLATTKREHLWAALRLPLVAIGTAGLGVLTGEARALLVVPSLSQAAFAGVFLSSLRGTPLVEHFARMQKPTLRSEEIQYCRTVTLVWGVVLSSAAVLGLALALAAPIEVWTAFTAVGNYVLVAIVFSIEYIVRKLRFREYGSMPVDRLLAKIFPPTDAREDVRHLDLTRTSDDGTPVVTVLASYAFFGGHFPGNPMLPGVVQLSEIVVPMVRRQHPELGALRQLRRIRFRRPVRPGETLRVDLGAPEHLTDTDDSARTDVRFDLRVGNAVVANGVVSFESARTAG